jgi:hypothetical protein
MGFVMALVDGDMEPVTLEVVAGHLVLEVGTDRLVFDGGEFAATLSQAIRADMSAGEAA